MSFMKKPLWRTHNSWSGDIYVFASTAGEAAGKVDKYLKAEAKAAGVSREDTEIVTKVEIMSGEVLV